MFKKKKLLKNILRCEAENFFLQPPDKIVVSARIYKKETLLVMSP